jgi:hypothetical protein
MEEVAHSMVGELPYWQFHLLPLLPILLVLFFLFFQDFLPHFHPKKS